MIPQIDPDENFQAATSNCDYYDQDEFLNAFSKTRCPNLKILHINARSLNKNFTSIKSYLNILQNPFSVVGISETWLQDIQDPLVQIHNFSMEGSC